eukprot:scaffold3096_cov403-Prasinococcus_capsulatus_cf.AAC.18
MLIIDLELPPPGAASSRMHFGTLVGGAVGWLTLLTMVVVVHYAASEGSDTGWPALVLLGYALGLSQVRVIHSGCLGARPRDESISMKFGLTFHCLHCMMHDADGVFMTEGYTWRLHI